MVQLCIKFAVRLSVQQLCLCAQLLGKLPLHGKQADFVHREPCAAEIPVAECLLVHLFRHACVFAAPHQHDNIENPCGAAQHQKDHLQCKHAVTP